MALVWALRVVPKEENGRAVSVVVVAPKTSVRRVPRGEQIWRTEDIVTTAGAFVTGESSQNLDGAPSSSAPEEFHLGMAGLP